MARMIIDLSDHEAEALDYRANSINGGHVNILVPNDEGNGYREVCLDRVRLQDAAVTASQDKQEQFMQITDYIGQGD